MAIGQRGEELGAYHIEERNLQVVLHQNQDETDDDEGSVKEFRDVRRYKRC